MLAGRVKELINKGWRGTRCNCGKLLSVLDLSRGQEQCYWSWAGMGRGGLTEALAPWVEEQSHCQNHSLAAEKEKEILNFSISLL